MTCILGNCSSSVGCRQCGYCTAAVLHTYASVTWSNSPCTALFPSNWEHGQETSLLWDYPVVVVLEVTWQW